MTPLSPPSPPRTARATIRDVARLADVGIKTVSRVMNDEPNVSSSTAERVRQAAAALNYLPDIAAGNLRRSDRRTRTIGLLVGDVTDPFFALVHRTVEDVATGEGFSVFASSSDDNHSKERSALDAFIQRRVDGLILTPTAASQARLSAEQERGTPLIFIDRVPNGILSDAVASDHAAAAARATTHLIRHGHRRLAALFDLADIWTTRERRRGFREALARAGIPEGDNTTVIGIRNEEQARQAVHRLLTGPNPPTAILAGRNSLTIGSIRALRHLGQHRHVALVGLDDIPTADLMEPGITVVEQRPSQIARLAVERLFARLNGSNEPFQTIEVATELIERGSGEIFPA